MLDNNDITMVQDTSTHAMTEVALGLSMAFFALLIIALMSVTLPTKVDHSTQALNSPQKFEIDTTEQVNLSIIDKQSEQEASVSVPSSNELVLLFWGGQFFDTQQRIVKVENVMAQQNVIVAVDPKIPFNQLINIQAKFTGKALRLTKLSEQWRSALSKDTPSSNSRAEQ
jgi:hypothetical protein